jgi:RNA polymerase sigma-70 factor (ECF subfamily)
MTLRDLPLLLAETSWIHALARKLVSDPHLAADLAQDACVEALERAPTGERSLRGWLATVVRRRLGRERRSAAHRAERERARWDVDRLGTDEIVERAETHKNVVLAVLALPEPCRGTLLLRFFEQLSYAEIARRAGVTEAAVNSRVTRALGELRTRLETTYGDRRALGLALIPLAELPTTGLVLTTAGWTLWLVRLIVPANFVGTLDLETMGTLELPPAFGLMPERDIAGRSTLRTTLGAGGGRYRLRTGAGDVAVAVGRTLPEEEPLHDHAHKEKHEKKKDKEKAKGR